MSTPIPEGRACWSDPRESEDRFQVRNETQYLYHEYKDPVEGGQFNTDGDKHYLITLVNSPRKFEFSPSFISILRLIDGALVIVDYLEGLGLQGETLLKQSLCEKV